MNNHHSEEGGGGEEKEDTAEVFVEDVVDCRIRLISKKEDEIGNRNENEATVVTSSPPSSPPSPLASPSPSPSLVQVQVQSKGVTNDSNFCTKKRKREIDLDDIMLNKNYIHRIYPLSNVNSNSDSFNANGRGISISSNGNDNDNIVNANSNGNQVIIERKHRSSSRDNDDDGGCGGENDTIAHDKSDTHNDPSASVVKNAKTNASAEVSCSRSKTKTSESDNNTNNSDNVKEINISNNCMTDCSGDNDDKVETTTKAKSQHLPISSPCLQPGSESEVQHCSTQLTQSQSNDDGAKNMKQTTSIPTPLSPLATSCERAFHPLPSPSSTPRTEQNHQGMQQQLVPPALTKSQSNRHTSSFVAPAVIHTTTTRSTSSTSTLKNTTSASASTSFNAFLHSTTAMPSKLMPSTQIKNENITETCTTTITTATTALPVDKDTATKSVDNYSLNNKAPDQVSVIEILDDDDDVNEIEIEIEINNANTGGVNDICYDLCGNGLNHNQFNIDTSSSSNAPPTVPTAAASAPTEHTSTRSTSTRPTIGNTSIHPFPSRTSAASTTTANNYEHEIIEIDDDSDVEQESNTDTKINGNHSNNEVCMNGNNGDNIDENNTLKTINTSATETHNGDGDDDGNNNDDDSDDDIYVVEVRNDTKADLEKKLRQASKRREDLLLKAKRREQEEILRSSAAGTTIGGIGKDNDNDSRGVHINRHSWNNNDVGWIQSNRIPSSKNSKVNVSNRNFCPRTTTNTQTFRTMSASSTETTGSTGTVKSKRRFYFLDQESALKEQDRLLRESADRLLREKKKEEQQQKNQKNNASATASSLSSSSLGGHDYIVTIAVEDVTKLPSNHWKWTNPWCRLGLPPKTNYDIVKKNYRKLSLLYHPDKARFDDSIHRFQAIKEAYETITEQLGM